jgi:hypothetical protein
MGIVTAPEFVTAVVAAVALRDVDVIPDTGAELDQLFEKVYDKFINLPNGKIASPTFTFRTNALHGDSSVFREALYAVNKSGAISLDNPEHRDIRIQLSKSAARSLLSRPPFDGDFQRMVAAILLE